MNRISTKLLGLLAIILFIAVMPVVVFATNDDMSVVSTQNENGEQEYIIYIKDYTDKKFKYAFTSNANPEEMDLSYINSISDLGENQVAILNAKTYEKFSNQTIYIWAKDENEKLILEGIELNLNDSITKENIENTENITKRINVTIADSEDKTTEIRNENIEGVEETASVGFVQITDNKKATYYYQLVKLSISEEYAKLSELAEKMNNQYDEMDMYEKIQTVKEFNDLYEELIEKDSWKKVENMTIEQPENSVEGDKYIVFLKKVDGEEITLDAQFLTCYDDYKPNVVKEQKITQETTRLPITYDSIALIVILAVIVIALIVVFIRMKSLKQKNEEK